MRFKGSTKVVINFVPCSKEESETRWKIYFELMYEAAVQRVQEEEQLRKEGKEIPVPPESNDKWIKESETPKQIIYRVEKAQPTKDTK